MNMVHESSRCEGSLGSKKKQDEINTLLFNINILYYIIIRYRYEILSDVRNKQ